MKKLHILLMFAFLLITASCSDDNDESPKPVVPELPFVDDIESVIEDVDFKAYLKTIAAEFDIDENGKLSSEEVKAIKVLTLGEKIEKVDPEEEEIPEDESEEVTSKYDIKSLKGIEYFLGLEELVVRGRGITSVDLSKNLKLKVLWVSITNIESLDLSANQALEELWFQNNLQMIALELGNKPNLLNLVGIRLSLSSLDLSKCPKLESIEIMSEHPKHKAPLTTLDLSKCPDLVHVNISKYSNLEMLNIDGCTKLNTLGYSKTKINTPISTTHCPDLEYLNCESNSFTSLDISSNTNLRYLYCGYNELATLDISNNKELYFFRATNNPLATLHVSPYFYNCKYVSLPENVEIEVIN